MAKKAQSYAKMPTETLKCRSLGHAWDIELVTRRRLDGEVVWQVSLTCLRDERHQRDDVVPVGSLSDLPNVLSRSYGYPDNYIVDRSWGDAGLIRRNARDVLFRRLRENVR